MKRRKDKPKVRQRASVLATEQMREIFLAKCVDRDHAKEWVKQFWGVDIPDCIVSRYSNCSPMHAIWEMYENAIYNKVGMDTLYIAPRGGIKTLGVAIVESLMMYHDHRGVVHIGAIEKQSKRAYSYFQNFINRNKALLSSTVEKSTIEKTSIILDDDIVTLECLPTTMSALNGPHEAFVCMDELDTLSGEGIGAYKQINGIPVKHRITGAPPLKVGISTRKSSYGLVQKQIDNAEEQGRSIRMWNQIDLMRKCTPDRHGTEIVKGYINQSIMRCISQDEFDKLGDDKKPDYISYDMTDGCLRCPLASVCLGDSKNQVCTSSMLEPIDEVIKKVKGADIDWVMAELMCLKPSVEGIVFKEFDRSRHVVGWDSMWTVLMGKAPQPDEIIDEIKFLRKLHELKVPIFCGVDFGWTSPSAAVISAVDQNDNVYVLKVFAVTKMNDPTFIHYLKTRFHKQYKIQMYYPDISAGSAIDLMKTANLPVATKIDKSENLGVQVIKRLLNVPGTSEIKLFIANEGCNFLVHEMERYHYEKDAAGTVIDGKFAKEFDHSIDGLRYTLVSVLGKARFVISHDAMTGLESELPVRLADGSYTRAPSFYELAQIMGSQVAVPEAKPFNKSDEDEGDGPDGFSWTF